MKILAWRYTSRFILRLDFVLALRYQPMATKKIFACASLIPTVSTPCETLGRYYVPKNSILAQALAPRRKYVTKMEIKEKSRDYEFYCFGTVRVFEKRANNLKFYRNLITFLGLVTPLIAGSIFLSFGTHEKITPYLVAAAGIAGTIQLILSAWSIVARWDESYEYAVESLRANTELYNSWKSLRDESDSTSAPKQFQIIKKNYEERELKDLGQNIKDKEKRFANFETLKYYQQACHLCQKIPNSQKPTKCNGCGNF